MSQVNERISELEKKIAVIENMIDRRMTHEKEFQADIKETFDYMKQRNFRVDEFIEREISIRRDSAEFWQDVKTKLATSGIIGALTLVGYVSWYAVKHFVNDPK